MDLNSMKVDVSEKHRILLNDPNGSPLKDDKGERMWVEITGPQHPDYRTVQSQFTNTRLGKKRIKLTAKDIEEEQLELAIISVRAWHIVMGGKPMECTKENVTGVLAEPGFYWLRDQVVDAMTDDANFFQKKTTK